MLTVHHLGISQSERIVWLCEELGLDYEFKRYQRRADNNLAPDEYKALHPIGTAPIITDGDLTLPESGAIVEYITGKYGDGSLTPGPDDPDFATHLFWLHFANGTMMANAMMGIALQLAGVQKKPDMVEDRQSKAWRLIEDHLGQADYFGGRKLSTADIMMDFGLTTMAAFMPGPDIEQPNLDAYLERITSRPAYRRAMAKAEPDGVPNA